MKAIHLIGGGDVGGAKTHVLSLIRELSNDMEVELISFRTGEFVAEAQAMGINVTVIHSGNPISDIRTLSLKIKKGGYDIMHCHGAKANVMGAIIRRICRTPVVTTVHSDYRLDYMGNKLKHCTNGIANTVALRFLDGYIGVTDNFADMLIARGFDPYRIYSLYNGIDFNIKPNPKMSKEDYLKSIGFDVTDEDIICGIAVRFHPVKDIATIIKAFSLARERCPKMRLIIGGDGEQAEMLKSMVRDLGLEEHVKFPGWITDMDTFLNAIDINLLSSLSESFPYSVLEAVRAGCTMVCTSVGGLPVLIDNGVNGLLFEPGNVFQLEDHLEFLYENREQSRIMADRLLQKASRLYSLENMVHVQKSIYEKVLHSVALEKQHRGGMVICGSYGRGNAGDDAILMAVVGEMQQIEPDSHICVLSRRPKETRSVYHINSIYTFNLFSAARAMLKSKLYINGGGSLVQDATSSRSLYFYLFTIFLARILGCKVMMYGCGIGPVNKSINRWFAAKIINSSVHVITLRDPGSLQELSKMSIIKPKISLAADPTLNLEPAGGELLKSALFSEGIPEEGRYIAFALRNWHGFNKKIKEFSKAADYAYEKYGLTPVFIPMEHRKDLQASEDTAHLMKNPSHVITGRYDVHTAISILSRMTVVVAMRLHALVFAAGQGIPVIGIAYDSKVKGFMDYIGYDMCSDYNSISYEILKNYIDKAMENTVVSEGIKTTTKQIRENERENIRAVKELLQQ